MFACFSGNNKPRQSSNTSPSSTSPKSSSSRQQLNDQLSSELLSILLSYFSLEEKLRVLRFVSKAWFTFCWISTNKIHIDQTWNQQFVEYVIKYVVLDKALPFVEELRIEHEAVFKKEFSTTSSTIKLFSQKFASKSRRLKSLYIKPAISADELYFICTKLPNLTHLHVNIHNCRNETTNNIISEFFEEPSMTEPNNIQFKSNDIVLPKLKSITIENANLSKEFISKFLLLMLQKNLLMNLRSMGLVQSVQQGVPSTDGCEMLDHLEIAKSSLLDEAFEQFEKYLKFYCENELKIFGSVSEKSYKNTIPLKSLIFKYNLSIQDSGCVACSNIFKGIETLHFDKNKKPELTFGAAPKTNEDSLITENNGLTSILYKFKDTLKDLKLSEFAFHASGLQDDIPYNFTQVLTHLTELREIHLDLGSCSRSVSVQAPYLCSNLFELSNHLEKIVLNECGDVLTQEGWDSMTGMHMSTDNSIYPKLHTLYIHSGKMYNVTRSLIRENAFVNLKHLTLDYCCRIESLFTTAKEPASTSTINEKDEVVSVINKKKLHSLTFERCIRLRRGMEQLLAMCDLKVLEQLDFIDSREYTNFEWMLKLNHVKQLDLSNNIQMKDEDLRGLVNCEQLEKLSLAHNKTLNGKGLKYLANSPRVCETMRELNLDWCTKLEDEGLESVSKFTNLRVFNILHVKRINRFDYLKSLTQLETLILVRCFNIKDDNIIPVIENCPHIRILTIHGGHYGYNEFITNKTIKAITQHLRSIQQLTINFAAITDKGVKELSSLPYLTHLNVQRCKVTEKMQKYFPHTSIIMDIDYKK
ncbi:hypothetical protein C9374_006770 [Naegleria lovaniensis]|uniref:F-box domain-containing protein n=1 Tax=Naegleria lovaniensis TaxID=51637 RepID=A0AA88GJE0_NAELO|nr:uncharacterized protein C9374_006770 [Naegleria lovaniensis]KAG2379653.1 hypothetical protein C9374_006770 [Naegleria lovaniensis]